MANCQLLLLFFSINAFQISGKKYIVRTRDGGNEVNKETSNQTTGASLKVYDLLLLGGSVGGPTSEKNQNSVVFNPI